MQKAGIGFGIVFSILIRPLAVRRERIRIFSNMCGSETPQKNKKEKRSAKKNSKRQNAIYEIASAGEALQTCRFVRAGPCSQVNLWISGAHFFGGARQPHEGNVQRPCPLQTRRCAEWILLKCRMEKH
jgi:hypothetical protein